MSETALVTGAAGFIGSHVAAHCLALGMEVVGLDDLSGGFAENVPAGVRFVQGSVTDAPLLEQLFAEHRFAYVYHLAAYAAEGLSHFIRRFNYENNLLGSVNLVNQAVRHESRCLVFTSSIAVYGAGQTPMTEEMTPQPEDPYGIAKYAVELDLRAAQHLFGLDHVVFRPHNVYGERQNLADRYRNVIGIFMNQVMQGRPMTVFGDGSQTRAFSHVDDVAPLIARSPLLPAARNQVFNVGADQPCSVKELALEVSRAFAVAPQIEHLPARSEVLHAFCDHRKARRVFGEARPVDLRDGLSRMAEWARRRGPTPPFAFRAVEVRKCLPPSWNPGS
ncbi:MAG TPA: NAD-dependent epimerase/dehydratase family protein [Vicinamibacteria bacterium]|nr:NAD-dependent epimerase/dehydratase family protein [Vicinamibacteria bacterium]